MVLFIIPSFLARASDMRNRYSALFSLLCSNYFVISNYLFAERSDYFVERSDYFLERSDRKMERNDLERSDQGVY